MKLIPTIYWAFISLTQIYLIIDKISTDDFYLWNIIALAGSLLFLINSLALKKIMKTYESVLILFLIINCITTIAAEFILLSYGLKLYGSILILLASLFTAYQINKKSVPETK